MTTDASSRRHHEPGADGLLEREQERATIEQALTFGQSGTGAQILISGSGGVGKSRLLDLAADLAERGGVTVLRGRGRALEREFAFGVVIQLFEPLWTSLSSQHRSALSAGRSRAAADLLGQGRHPQLSSGDSAAYPVIHGLFRMLVELARTADGGRDALALIVDDLHESDAVSLAFLAYISERLAQIPLTLIMATRPGDQTAHPVAFAALRRTSVSLAPAALSKTAVADAVRQRIPGAGKALWRECHRLTGGNPFLLGELLTELAGRDTPPAPKTLDAPAVLPASVRERVRARLASLEHDIARVAHHVAGATVADIQATSSVTGLSPDAVARSAQRLTDIGLFATGEPLRFASPLLAAAVGAAPAPVRDGSAGGATVRPGHGSRSPAPSRLGLPSVLARMIAGDDLEHVVEVSTSELAGDRHGGAAPEFLLARGWAQLEQGHVDAGRADADAVIDLVGANSLVVAGATAILARCLLELGDIDRADALLMTAAVTSRESPLVLEQRSRVRLAQHRPADALADALRAGELSTRLAPYLDAGAVLWRSSAALAHLALGEPGRAQELAADELAHARPARRTRVVIRNLRVLGLAARGEAGLELLHEAAAIGELAGPRLEHVHTLVELGSALRRANRRSDAREPLRQALDLAHRHGLHPLEARARTELIASGGRPRRHVLTGVESLTASQQRVAELAARGLTTRQMAETLFVSPKTVEFHLRHIYQKLGVSSRDALALALRP